MAHVVNGRDSRPKYLGAKIYEGEIVKAGSLIFKQRGTRLTAGANVGMGRDYTLYALADGKVDFSEAGIVSVVRASKDVHRRG